MKDTKDRIIVVEKKSVIDSKSMSKALRLLADEYMQNGNYTSAADVCSRGSKIKSDARYMKVTTEEYYLCDEVFEEYSNMSKFKSEG